MISEERIEAIEDRLETHDKAIEGLRGQLRDDTLRLAIRTGRLAAVANYNLHLAGFDPKSLERQAYVQYIRPKLESARKEMDSAKSIDEVLHTADEFGKDLFSYVKTHLQDA